MKKINQKLNMGWKNVKQDNLPICNKKAFDDEDWMESEIVMVVVNQIRKNIQYITFGKIDEHNEWMIGDFSDYLTDKEEVTHWMSLPDKP
jgi:hypothetical protein